MRATRHFKGISLAFLMAFALGGCALRMVTGGHEFSPDEKFRINVVVRTSPGVPYSSMDKKTINIGIYAPKQPDQEPHFYLFTGEYTFSAAHVEWNIEWHGTDRVTVDLFDFSPGVSPPDKDIVDRGALKRLSSARLLDSFEFVRGQDGKSFGLNSAVNFPVFVKISDL